MQGLENWTRILSVGDLKDYRRDQDLLFQRLWEQERGMNAANAQEFVTQAARAGYSVDDLLEFLDSGIAVADLAKTVLSKLPEYRTQQK